jgi:peptide/nickel transport system substrate-binding protein
MVPAAAKSHDTLTSATSAMVVNLPTAPAGLDPAEQCGTYDFLLPGAVYTTLTQFGFDRGPHGTTQTDYSKVEPDLAKSWTITDSGTVYTFHLRSGVKFNDGTPVTSADVAFSFEREITMGGCGAYGVLDGHYTPTLIKSITTPNPLTAVFTLNLADPEVPLDWAFSGSAVLEPGPIEAHGGVVANTPNTWMAGHISGGGGPFRLTSYQPGVRAVLTAVPHYWQPAKTHEIILNYISDAATLSLDARDGEADVTVGLPDSDAHSLSKVSTLREITDPTPTSEQIGFNNDVAPTNNLDVREALTDAVPYAEILKKVVFNYGRLFYGEYQPDMVGFNSAIQKPRPYDLAKARSLLAQSGVSLPIHIPLIIDSGDAAAAEIASIVQNIWSQIQVDVTIQTLSPTTYINTLEAHNDVAFMRLDGPGVPAPAFYMGYDSACGIAYNLTQMCVPKIDTLLQGVLKVPVSQQGPYWNQIDKLWIADFPKIQVYNFYAVTILGPRVTSYSFSDTFDSLWTWTIK